MFRRQLSWALGLLGLVSALQGVTALWAVGEVERHVLRGRVAADIQHGFAELTVDKQRLRHWWAQRGIGLPTDDAQRDALLQHMQVTLQRLDEQARQAVLLDESPAARQRQAERRQALEVLQVTVDRLSGDRVEVTASPPVTGVAQAWQEAADRFDRAEGQDLRTLLQDSMRREAMAVREKRADTDRALFWMRSLWTGSAAALAVAALLLAIHFARVLRRPLRDLSEGARAFRSGQLDHRITTPGRDEFAELAVSINFIAAELADHRRREAQARQVLEEQVQSRTQALRAALAALQAQDTRRRQLFADISHELRTPTTAIRGEAQVTLRGGDRSAAEYREALGRIADTARQLGLVIDDLLTVARQDLDALALERRPLDLRVVIEEVASAGASMGRERGLEVECAPCGEPLPVLGDPARLRQALLALVDNALCYSESPGRIRIEVAVVESGSVVAVTVQDWGIGMDEEELARAFERHHRGARARSHRAEGSGLGLAIADMFVRAHDGVIDLRSALGTGTRATVRLPLCPVGTDAP